ncbi:MAG TPA: ATP-binding protein, partial [Chloroflexota bacterium]|nr:ATP-binding protein [Chloroflexota bacterium]
MAVGLSQSVRTAVDELWLDSGLDDMRRQSLRDLSVTLSLFGVALIPLISFVFGSITSQSVGVVLVLLLTSFLTFVVSGSRPRLAAYLLIAGLIGVLSLVFGLAPESAVLPWFAVVTLVAGFLIGPGFGAGLAVVGTLVLAIGGPLSGIGAPTGLRLSEILLLWAATGLSWLALRPLLIALQWSWEQYRQVREVNQLLKDRQGELGRTVKSLNETLDRLDKVNHELDRARRAANEARQLKSEFAANVSHELRTPLNLIIGFSEMMVTSPQSYGGLALPSVYREDAVAIYRNARHLSGLVDDILDLSQLEAGYLGLRRELVSLASIVGEAIETVRILYSQRGLAVTSLVSEDLPPIFADRTRLRQILINLLANAARFVDQGGAVIEARTEERDFVVEVTDTGCGIAPEDLPRVFDEFWQTGGPRRHGGSGVGLAVSKRFVEMHGGAIWVRSQPGEGTTFTFTLPRSADLPEMALPRPWNTWARLPEAAPERRAIAVVADDEDAVHLLERHLDDLTVTHFSDVTALSVFPRRTALAGVVVIGPNAAIAQRRALVARAHLPGVPLFACGLTSSFRSLADDLGVADHLVKPVDSERLARVLARLGAAAREILVVDDDPDAVRLLARMIRSISPDYQVRTSLGGAEALRQVEVQRPDAVFLDLVMPEIDGYSLIQTLRSRPALAEIALVAVSAQLPNRKPIAVDGLTLLHSDGLTIKSLIDGLTFGL